MLYKQNKDEYIYYWVLGLGSNGFGRISAPPTYSNLLTIDYLTDWGDLTEFSNLLRVMICNNRGA